MGKSWAPYPNISRYSYLCKFFRYNETDFPTNYYKSVWFAKLFRYNDTIHVFIKGIRENLFDNTYMQLSPTKVFFGKLRYSGNS